MSKAVKDESPRVSPVLFAALGVVLVVGIIWFVMSRTQKPDAAATSAPPPSPTAQTLIPSPDRIHHIGPNTSMGGGGGVQAGGQTSQVGGGYPGPAPSAASPPAAPGAPAAPNVSPTSYSGAPPAPMAQGGGGSVAAPRARMGMVKQ